VEWESGKYALRYEGGPLDDGMLRGMMGSPPRVVPMSGGTYVLGDAAEVQHLDDDSVLLIARYTWKENSGGPQSAD
jgi:hypothetical protein